MTPHAFVRILGLTATLWASSSLLTARAATVIVPAQPAALATAVARAAPGDTLRLASGHHDGGIVIKKSLTLEGQNDAVVDGGGHGSILAVLAPNVTIRGLTLTNSGASAIDFDSAVYIDGKADHARIENNRMDGTLFGVVVRGVNDAVIRNNRIRGRTDLYETSRGDGIHIRNSTRDEVDGNDIEGGRDGIFAHASHNNILKNNRMRHLRFAIHYMYCNDNVLSGNLSAHNTIGYALMYSNGVQVMNNVSLDDHDHGLMLHTAYHSVMNGNYVRGTHDTGLFIYTAAHNAIYANRVENSLIGVHLSGGSEDNQFYDNAMINNQTQVKYSGTTYYEWSKDGRGNYWSDNVAFDMAGDGIAATAYRPNTVMDRVLWRYPLAKLLMASPVMEALRFAQSQFPALMPGGVVDSHPLMAPPPLSADLPSLNEAGS